MEMVLGARGGSQEAPAWPIWSLLCELTLAMLTSRVVGDMGLWPPPQGVPHAPGPDGESSPQGLWTAGLGPASVLQGCWYLASARQLGPAGGKVCGRWRSLGARISLARPPGPQLLCSCVGPGGGRAADGARGWFAQGRSGTF